MKIIIYVSITIFSLIGAYIPVVLFNSDPIGIISIIFGVIGSFFGIWVGYKAYQYLGE